MVADSARRDVSEPYGPPDQLTSSGQYRAKSESRDATDFLWGNRTQATYIAYIMKFDLARTEGSASQR